MCSFDHRQLDGLFEDDDDEEDSSPTAAVAATATTTSKQDLQRPREAESVVGETEAGGSAAAEAKARLVELAKVRSCFPGRRRLLACNIHPHTRARVRRAPFP